MSTPFVLVTLHEVRLGRLAEVTDLTGRYEQSLAAEEPDLLAFHAHLSDDGRHLSLMHVLVDADAAEHHIGVAGPFIAEATELVRNVRVEVYGVPGPRLQAALDHNAENGTSVFVLSRPLTGFSRLTRQDPAVAGGVR